MHTQNEELVHHLDSGRAAVMEILQRGTMNDLDIHHLRREVFGDGAINRAEAEALFALERSGIAKSGEWAGFFVEAITDYLVWQNRPTGVVSAEQAEWLIEQADRAKSVNGLAVMVNVLAEAHRVPQWLPAAAHGRIAAGWSGVAEALEAAQLETKAAA